jgi:hypothetical protein
MAKIDYKKELKHLYNPSAKELSFVDVPAMNFIQVDGEGDPNTSEQFQGAMNILFSLSFTLKFMVKKLDTSVDYGVMPPEGLWWTDDMQNFDMNRKELWKWRLMIMQPDVVTPTLFTEALETVRKKKNLSGLEKARFEAYHEGPSAQIMHIGPFSTEGPTVAKIHEAIHQAGHELSGLHHEIYLNDFRKASPERLKTVIRQPYR